ncbi:MAG: DUF2330 domain-containing protein, partial [Armatimonadetes bacterium]|nr:DUF2330 domain-containing protein [Armatimonadota bacterium]
MKRRIGLTLAVTLSLAGAWQAHGACCYFSALHTDVSQPEQKVFLSWDPQLEIERWIVQPQFMGDATEFGMVIPTPARPSILEAPREFFRSLGVYTILKPMPTDKYRPGVTAGGLGGGFGGGFGGGGLGGGLSAPPVRVVETGVVGSLDYKIV